MSNSPRETRVSGAAARRLRQSAPFVAAATVPAVMLTGVGTAQAAEPAPQMSAGVQKLIAAHQAKFGGAATGVPANQLAALVKSDVGSVAAPAEYTVREGDTVTSIALAFGLDFQEILRQNNLGASTLIFPGDVLVLGSGGEAPSGGAGDAGGAGAQGGSGGEYVVQEGDTVSAIAVKTGVDQQTILNANGLQINSLIHPGQKLSLGAGISVQGGESAPAEDLVPDSFGGVTYPDHVVEDANTNKAALLNSVQPSQDEMRSIVVQTAYDLGVDPVLAQAISFQESGFQQTAVSPANAIGAMQVIPSTGEWASELVGRDLNLLDAGDNAAAGVAVLRALVASSSSLEEAIGSYYQGQGSIRERGMYEDTKQYVENIKSHMESFR